MSAKHTATFYQDRGKQHGAVLIIMLVILIVGIAAILVNSLSSAALKNARQQNTAAALAQAKEALIGFAVTYSETHTSSPQVDGYLPCPDQAGGANEGSPASTCGSANISQIGRLPWKTLDLSALRDGDGECLWYAVSGNYKDSPKTSSMMNWDTDGQFQAYAADGTQLTNANEVVAVIFAPGAPLSGQSRTPDGSAPTCGGNYNASGYLDSATVNGINFNNASVTTGQYIQGTSGGAINDQMVFITKQDIWNTMQKQLTNPNNPLVLLTQRVALCIANYGTTNRNFFYNPAPNNLSLPWPAPTLLSDVTKNNNYNDYANIYAGRVPMYVNDSVSASHNSIASPYYLLSTTTCPATANWTAMAPWWTNWKEHLFYAIGQSFKPSLNTNQSCGTCLSINGSGQYAAVVMFAGPKLSALNQTRVNNKAYANQYLEGNNYNNVTFGGAAPYTNYQTATASTTFNDLLYCIKADLSVVACP